MSDPVYPVAIDPDISEEIVADSDDGTDAPDVDTFYSTFCEFGKAFIANRDPAWRFQSVAVPSSGDTIDLAIFKINATFAEFGGGKGNLYGYDTDDSVTWSNSIRPELVAKTTASVYGAIPAAGQYSFTITSVVQEIVDRTGWATGNDISVFFINSSGIDELSELSDYPSSGNHGRLEIDYTVAAGGGFVPRLALLGVG